jgi:hypothetical protein
MRFERSHKRSWKRDGTPALVRFQLSELKTAARSLQACAGVTSAARRAIIPMTIDAAGVRVTAAMTPALPLELPADGECPRVEVDELPSQPNAA